MNAVDPGLRRSSGDHAATYIKRLIFDQHLRPGDRVPQDEVAQALGISRIPVREALIALEREGWITIAMHRGAFVNDLDEQAVRDHYALFGLVYGLAVRRALDRGNAELAGTLDEIARSTTSMRGDAAAATTLSWNATAARLNPSASPAAA
jgi:DNA-binding GntR family transcriptional regulator